MKKILIVCLLCLMIVGCQETQKSSVSKSESSLQLVETDDSWGIVLNVDNVTDTGLTLICSQNGGEVTGDLQTGEKYWVEEKRDGKWQELPTPQKPVWSDVSYIIQKQDFTHWDIQWEDLYGSLSNGEYRIGKEIQDFRGGSDYDEKAYYSEFVIQ